MFKKLITLCTAVLGLGLLLGSVKPSQSDVVNVSTLTGPSTGINLYSIVSGYKAPSGAVSGYAYFGTADGASMWANISQVRVTDAFNAQVVALGYFNDSIPAIAYWSVVNGKTSVRILNFNTGQVYENVAPGAIYSGQALLQAPPAQTQVP